MVSDESKSSAGRPAADQAAAAKKLFALIVLACLVISVCFNVYVVSENLVLKRGLTNYATLRRQALFYEEMQQLTQRFVAEMSALAKDDEKLRPLLGKYWRSFCKYGLDATTRASSANRPG